MAQEDQHIAAVGDWAIATDGIQWILQKRAGAGWRSISFVRTSKATLRQCCHENRVSPADIKALLAPLPDYFPNWDAQAEAFADAYSLFIAGKAPRPTLKTENRSMHLTTADDGQKSQQKRRPSHKFCI